MMVKIPTLAKVGFQNHQSTKRTSSLKKENERMQRES
jgi:hypothetical protein